MFLPLVDYNALPGLKIWGHCRVVESGAASIEQVRDPDYAARVERVIRLEVEAWDTNCSSHIPHLVPASTMPPGSPGHPRAEGSNHNMAGN